MGTFSCSGFQPDGSPTWFACPTTNTQTTTTTTTTTTASPTTTTTTTTSPATTISSPTRPHRSNTPPTTSTALTRTPTASPNPESNATNSIPTSSQTVLPIQQHSGLSTGATAGIAIGCVAAGLIIGLLAALRRKHKDTTSVNQDVIIVESKAPSSIEATEGISSGAGIRLGQFLLDGAPDQEIVSELQSLGELICQHVEGHYSLQPVDANVQTLTQPLQSLGLGMHGSGLSTETIAALCANSYSRLLGLRYVISTVIFASIDFHSRSRLSLLPGTVAEFLQSMPPPEYGDNNQQAFSQALSMWRRLSAFLLHKNRSQRIYLQVHETKIMSQAQLLTSSLNNFLGSFVQPGRESQQATHLQEVVMECAKLGYVLFSHPVEWKFMFEGAAAGTANATGVVVCPGLEKCSDRDGNSYRPPRRVAAPVEVAL